MKDVMERVMVKEVQELVVESSLQESGLVKNITEILLEDLGHEFDYSHSKDSKRPPALSVLSLMRLGYLFFGWLELLTGKLRDHHRNEVV